MLISLLSTGLIYGISLSGPFLFDDQQNIVGNSLVQPHSLSWESLSTAAKGYPGFPGRPVATISFALNYYFFGLDPAAFKAINLLLHLLCGLALYQLFKSLLIVARERGDLAQPSISPPLVGAITAAIWLLHPLQVSTVLYAVQRMAILSALFCMAGMLGYLQMRRAQLKDKHGFGWGLFSLTSAVAAILSKENGALLPLYCGLIELSVFRLDASRPIWRRTWGAVWLGGIVLLVTLMLWNSARIGPWLEAAYQSREFTLDERLLTQPRILWFYLQLLLLPSGGAMGLYHDDIPVSQGWLSPASTLPAMLGLGALVSLSLAGLFSRHRLWALGPSLFFAGHLLESTLVPLEIVFEHRNYFPSTGLFFMISLTLAALPRRPLQYAGLTAILALLGTQTLSRSQLFTQPLDLVSHSLRNHPGSLRTQLWAGDTFLVLARSSSGQVRDAYYRAAAQNYRTAANLDRVDVIGLFELLRIQAEQAHPLDAALYSELASRLATQSVRPGTAVATHSFLDAIASGTNLFPAADAVELAQALLSNPGCQWRSRAIVLSALATVEAEILHDLPAAIAHSREATELQPEDPSLWIPHAAILFKAGHNKAAEQAVRKALAVDGGTFRPMLLNFLATIRAQASGGSPAAP